MVFIKLTCPPEEEQATISVRITTSRPTLSLKALKTPSPSTEPVLAIQVHLRCHSSKHPSRPLTLCAPRSIFDTSKPENGLLDNLALGMVPTGLVRTNNTRSDDDDDNNNSKRKVISLGNLRVHRARQDGDDSPNLRERPDMFFLSIPAQDSGEEITVTHSLTSERLFAFADGMTPDDLIAGEQYSIKFREDYVATMWWCWGGLEELQGKPLHSFAKGRTCLSWNGEGPSEEEIENEGWVVGEDISQLKFVVEQGGLTCAVEVVE